MTIISNPVTGLVTGQPISGDFSKQFSGSPPANNLTSIPPAMTQLEAASRAIVPLNINVSAVNSIGTGAGAPARCWNSWVTGTASRRCVVPL